MDTDRTAPVVRAFPLVARRMALGGLFGTGFKALSSHGVPDAEARKNARRKKKRRRKKCKKTSQEPCPSGTKTCGEQCIPSDECCRCGNGQQCCAGDCADLAADPDNCGACGNQCAISQCFNGACGCTDDAQCPTGCTCTLREDGGQACFCLVSNLKCVSDAECPVGSFCLNAQICSPLLCVE